MARLEKVTGERALYQDPSSRTYYVRIYHEGRDTYRSLETTRIGEARERMDARRAAKAASKLGLALEPDEEQEQPPPVTVANVIRAYEGAGYPDKRGISRKEGPHRRGQEDACAILLQFFGEETLVDDLRPKLLDDYHLWRMETVTRGTGHRTTDLELNALSNALFYAIRTEVITTHPILVRTRYHRSTEARHCRELAPANVDELHRVARRLFSESRAESLGWQMLFEALTGLRTNEALSLQLNARSDEPGGLTEDGGSLCVRRSKKSGRDNPYLEVHDGLKQLLRAHKAWHKKRFPNSPWYFPGRDDGGVKPVAKCALTNALRHVYQEEMAAHEKSKPKKNKKNKKADPGPKQFTSHGMRAFYVLVRRSQGAIDSQIAWEINHVGGVGTLEKVYGSAPPHWSQGKGPKLSWIPKGELAWSVIQKQKSGSTSDRSE
jgi:integrase